MKKHKIKAICLDLDNALLDSRGRLTQHTKDTLLAFQEQGGKLILCSSRPVSALEPYGDELEMWSHNGWYAGLSGSQIGCARTGEIMEQKCLSRSEARDILHTLEDIQHIKDYEFVERFSPEQLLQILRYTFDSFREDANRTAYNILIYHGDELYAKRAEYFAAVERLKAQLDLQVDSQLARRLQFDPNKMLVCGEPQFISELYLPISSALLSYEVVLAEPGKVEITSKGVHVGSALKKIQETEHVSPEETAAFIGRPADASLISQAGWAIAMQNAVNLLNQPLADEAPDQDHDGVATFIEAHPESFLQEAR